MCANHYENPTMFSRVTAKNVGDVFFETHCRTLIGNPTLEVEPTGQRGSTTTASGRNGLDLEQFKSSISPRIKHKHEIIGCLSFAIIIVIVKPSEFCVRTSKETFPYWKLLFLSSIFKAAIAQKLCGEFC